MAKVAHRKRATRRTSRASRAAKPRSRRVSARPRSTGERSLPLVSEIREPATPERQEETEEENIQAQARVREDDSEDEIGTYDADADGGELR